MNQPIDNMILSYIKCRWCAEAGRPNVVAVGVTPSGLVQIWCEGCDRHVFLVKALPLHFDRVCDHPGHDPHEEPWIRSKGSC